MKMITKFVCSILIVLQLLICLQAQETTIPIDEHDPCSQTPTAFYTYQELKRDIGADNVTVIDVRTKLEIYKDGKIPQSLAIPLAELEDSLSLNKIDFESQYPGFKKLIPTRDNIVVHCQGGARALHAYLTVLKPLGFCNAKVYSGSFADWILNGGDIVKPETEANR